MKLSMKYSRVEMMMTIATAVFKIIEVHQNTKVVLKMIYNKFVR